MSRSHSIRIVINLCLSLALLACTLPSRPTIETGPDAEITFDGLHRVVGSYRFQRIWIKPGLQLAGYSKLLPVDAGIRYKREPRASRGEFELTQAQMERLRQGFRDAVEAELATDDRWEIVSEPGPDTLLVRVALIDLVVTAPPEPTTGRDRSYTSSVGEATLVVESYDSYSMEILARVADRRSVDRDAGSWRNDSIHNRAAAKRLFRYWARRLREGLDAASRPEWAGDEQAMNRRGTWQALALSRHLRHEGR